MPEKEAHGKKGKGERDFVNEPSSLDDKTHAELRMLYDESARTIRFAKHLQWWTVGSTLLAFGGIVAVVRILPNPAKLAHDMVGVIIILTVSVIFALIIHQFWQQTELAKIFRIEKYFSSLFAHVRRIKSRREADIYRFLLLFFMIAIIVIGATVCYLALQQFILNP